MTIKNCTCCGKPITTKNAQRVKRTNDEGLSILWFNCVGCNSTCILRVKKVWLEVWSDAMGGKVLVSNHGVVVRKVS